MIKNHSRIDIQVRLPLIDGIYRRRIRRKQKYKAPIIASLFVCVVVAVSLIASPHARAAVVLTPSTCLGGWSDTENATGIPDRVPGDSGTYSSSNSASVTGALADLFCGDFKGDIPAGTIPVSVRVDLSWGYVEKKNELQIPVTPLDLASSTSAALDAAPGSIGVQAPPIEAVPADPIGAPALLPSDSPQSLVAQRVLAAILPQTAYAQEVSDYPAQENAVLEVSYTVDGSTWHVLGSVTQFNFSESTFLIPVQDISQWSDLRRLQIRVRSLSSVGDIGTIYVDGMSLAAQYESSPKKEVTDESKPRPLTKEDSFKQHSSNMIIVHPEATASSTSVIFYQLYPNGSSAYIAETSAHGDAALSEYFAPPPLPGAYLMIQYDNENGGFDCTGISAAECTNDPHAMQVRSFKVLDDSADPAAAAAISI